MKAGIHPEYKEVTVKMVDGTTFTTRSTFKGETIVLDIDPTIHPAWTGGSASLNENAGKVAKFNSRFAGLNIGAKKED